MRTILSVYHFASDKPHSSYASLCNTSHGYTFMQIESCLDIYSMAGCYTGQILIDSVVIIGRIQAWWAIYTRHYIHERAIFQYYLNFTYEDWYKCFVVVTWMLFIRANAPSERRVCIEQSAILEGLYIYTAEKRWILSLPHNQMYDWCRFEFLIWPVCFCW